MRREFAATKGSANFAPDLKPSPIAELVLRPGHRTHYGLRGRNCREVRCRTSFRLALQESRRFICDVVCKMELGRRDFWLSLTTTAWTAGTTVEVCQGASAMYGLIAKPTATTGKRDELMTILVDGTGDMPGCFGYIVAKDSADENVVWMTETWERQASHHASLTLQR